MKYLILHDIRSAYNVGALFRTAEGAGFEKVFMTGYSPCPTDRFGRVQAEIKKTSLGASEILSWEKKESIVDLIKVLQKENFSVVAVEQSNESVSLADFIPSENVVYILGNEVEGIPEEVIKSVDKVVEIPMLGKKESLNVSVAAGIIMYHGLV